MQLNVSAERFRFGAIAHALFPRPKTPFQNHVCTESKNPPGNLPLYRFNRRTQTIQLNGICGINQQRRNPFVGT